MQYSLRVHGLAHATCEQEPILTWAPLRARPGSARNYLTGFRARCSRFVCCCAVLASARVFVLSTAPPCLLARSARGVSLSCRRRITSLHRTFNAIGIRAATNAFQANANFIATWLKIMVFGGMPNEDGSRPASALVLVVGRFASTRFAPPHPRRMILL